MNARTKLVLGLVALVILIPSAMSRSSLYAGQPQLAEVHETTDTRKPIRLAPAERDAIRAEMRTMLQSLNRIVHGLVAGDLVMVEKAARASGMGTTVDPDLRKKLPPPFLQLGLRTHKRFDQLADGIKNGETKDDVLKRLTLLTGYCVGCHAAYRLEEAR